MAIEPSIAESWSVSKDGLTYTFKLRQGIKFHEDEVFGGKAREITAYDVKFSFELACTKHEQNIMFISTLQDRLVGANEYYAASENGKPSFDLEGLKIIDPYTVELTLINPFSPFISILSSPALSIVPAEAYKVWNKHDVGSGPLWFPLVRK